MITISLNGEKTKVAKDTTLAQGLELWDYTQTKIAVAINGEFVPRSSYIDRQLHHGDQLDIVRPVGGG